MPFNPNPYSGRVIRFLIHDKGQDFVVIQYQDGEVRTCELDDPEAVAQWKMAAEEFVAWDKEQAEKKERARLERIEQDKRKMANPMIYLGYGEWI